MFTQSLLTWIRTRLPVLLILAALCCVVIAGRHEPGDTWQELLADSGVQKIVRLHWVDEPVQMHWVTGVAEIVPEAIVSENAGSRRDILVFQAMLGADGDPLRVRRVGNLTRTPHADDRILTMDRRFIVSVSEVGGLAGTIDAFDLRGDPLLNRDFDAETRPLGDRLKISVTHAQILGRTAGVGRRSYRLTTPRAGVSGVIDEGLVQVEADGRKASFSLETGDVVISRLVDYPLGLERQSQVVVVESWTQFLVNRFRAAPWFGATRIALLEKYVFDRVDGARRAWESLVGADTSALVQQVAPKAQRVLPKAVMYPVATQAIHLGPDTSWPPRSIDPPGNQWGFSRVEGEGSWQPWVPVWATGQEYEGLPWPVVRTAVRVNRHRPSEHVLLVAMDLRQLKLVLQAGSAHPKATTGLRGTGQIPRDAATLSRVVLAFNGGFKTSHGAYGMTLDRKMFVPVKPAMATVGFFEDGSVQMGTWPGRAPLGDYRREHEWQVQVARRGEAPEPPAQLVSLRQNLPPLVSDGKLNPGGARRWGGPVANLSHTTVPRSGMCVAPPSAVVFAWAKRSSAKDIGAAMILAGCEYGMHLDMNPYHTGMAMYHVPVTGSEVPEDIRGKGPVGTMVERASEQMSFDDRRYIAREVKDFFYVLRRQLLPARLGMLPPNMSPWSSSGLPIAMGVRPLAVSSRSDDGMLVVAIDSSMRPGNRAVKGAVRALYDCNYDGATKVVADGVWLETLPDVDKPVLRGTTVAGDTLLAGCQECTLKQLVSLLKKIPLKSADIVGLGTLRLDSYTESDWSPVVGVPYPETEDACAVFVPGEVVAPVGTTGFTP